MRAIIDTYIEWTRAYLYDDRALPFLCRAVVVLFTLPHYPPLTRIWNFHLLTNSYTQ